MQVKLYFPAANSTDWTGSGPGGEGIVRALVKDDNDLYAGQDSITFIDSTGLVGHLDSNPSPCLPQYRHRNRGAPNISAQSAEPWWVDVGANSAPVQCHIPLNADWHQEWHTFYSLDPAFL